MKRFAIFLLTAILLLPGWVNGQSRPNILWITCEDISPYLGCYGDSLAVTPNLDRLAEQGIRYTHAYANTAVCAPARSTIIMGMYASSMGTENMRSRYKIPEGAQPYTTYLKEAGYYCTNHAKTDYNTSSFNREIWDDCSNQATWRNRKPGQPFFAIFNLGISHEHFIFQYDSAKLHHDPAQMNLPPYHPDLPWIRNDWARFYDNITEMDRQAGAILEMLQDDGLADSTIVFFYSDHGGVLGRSKRFIYNTGTQVPFIVRFPDIYASLSPGTPGSTEERLISFVDLAPTLLSLAGIPKPENMQGHSFLGPYKEPDPGTVYFFRSRMDERYDMMLGITDGRYRYIFNFFPDRPLGQHIEYLWTARSMQAWEKAWETGACNPVQSLFWRPKPQEELYDTKGDPWEVRNLAYHPQYAQVRHKLTEILRSRILQLQDASFIPEPERVRINDTTTIFAFTHSKAYPLEKILKIAMATPAMVESHLTDYIAGLEHPNFLIRYWSIQALARSEKTLEAAIPKLPGLLEDPSPSVAMAAAQALLKNGIHEEALQTLHRYLADKEPHTVLTAVNLIQLSGAEVVRRLKNDLEQLNREDQDLDVGKAVRYALASIKE